jgi:uncharacterized membrane protein YeiH
MDASAFHIPPLLDYGATFLWAVTGALVAVRRGCDIVGVGVIALVSALGGGLIRDGLLLQQKPVAVTSLYYLPLIVLAAMIVALFRERLEPLTRHRTVDSIDAVGMGAFAVIGMQKAIYAGFTPWGVILTGMINAVGGGMSRDILVNEVPAILKPSQFYSLPVLAGCVLYLVLGDFSSAGPLQEIPIDAAWITIAFVFLGRLLTIRFNWRTQALLAPRGNGKN